MHSKSTVRIREPQPFTTGTWCRRVVAPAGAALCLLLLCGPAAAAASPRGEGHRDQRRIIDRAACQERRRDADVDSALAGVLPLGVRQGSSPGTPGDSHSMDHRDGLASSGAGSSFGHHSDQAGPVSDESPTGRYSLGSRPPRVASAMSSVLPDLHDARAPPGRYAHDRHVA
jgi:hypothetical protein